MKALVLGLGISGKSAVALLERRGAKVEVCDDALSPKHFETLQGFDLFVPSPGIPQTHPLYQLALKEKISISGEVDLFLQMCPNRCIGVTGTNGKTTTVMMIAHMLNAFGFPAVAAGNVGVPLCEVDESAICVLELSSFQLETITTQKLEIGVILNITPDHLDRYPSFDAYCKVKLSLHNCIKKEGTLFIHRSVPLQGLSGTLQLFDGGSLEAAKVVCRAIGVDDFSKLSTFERPPHRLELVEVINEISYINDSKATNVEATLYALGRVEGLRVLILGGRDKGLSFGALLQMLSSETQIIAFGEAREKIANELQPITKVHVVKTLKSAVEKAGKIAPKGATVLFSPGCASFDAFLNYEERGEAFKQYVRRSIS